LALLAPLLGFLLNLDFVSSPLLFATMLCGSPSISFLGTVGAALTLRAKRGGLLLALLMMPFYVPTLIFGISALADVTLDQSHLRSSFLLLTALSLFSCVVGPFAAAAALRFQNE
ncbi:MAG: heme exporter protein CcmB, partial [Hyphomicrobium sp.]